MVFPRGGSYALHFPTITVLVFNIITVFETHLYIYALNSLFQYKPFVEKKVYENGTVSYQGFCMDLLNELARTLNFS